MSWGSNATTWNTPAQPMPQTSMPEPAKLDDPISEEMKQRLIAANLPITADGILMLWQQTKAALEALKNTEMEIRKTAVKVYVPKPLEGINNVELGNGYVLKAVVKYNYNLDPDNVKVEAALDEITALGNQGPFIAERLVSWTPSLSLTEYRQLCDDARDSPDKKRMLDLINSVLTINEGAPSLDIKAPKSKK